MASVAAPVIICRRPVTEATITDRPGIKADIKADIKAKMAVVIM